MFVEGLESMDFKEAEEHLLKKWERIVSWRARYTGQSDAMMRFGANEFVARDVFEGTIEFLRLNRTVRYVDTKAAQVLHAETGKVFLSSTKTQTFSNGRTFHMNNSAPDRKSHKTGKMDLLNSGTILPIPTGVHLSCIKKARTNVTCRAERDRIVVECDKTPMKDLTWKDRGMTIDVVREVRHYDRELGVLLRDELISESGKCGGWTDYVTEDIEVVTTPI